MKVVSLREDEKGSDTVEQLSSPASRAALRRLLRDEDADTDEMLYKDSDREISLLKCLDEGSAPPPWDPVLDPPVFHAHGTLMRPVFTKLSYRQLIHDSPTFMPFLRALLTTKTLLFMGFSFSDEYLEELRSQCLALLVGSNSSGESCARCKQSHALLVGSEGGGESCGCCRQCLALHVGSNMSRTDAAASELPAPLGYAVMEFQRKLNAEGKLVPVEDEDKLLEYHRRHEGLGFLLYNVENNDHKEADETLEKIVKATSLRWRLHERLAGEKTSKEGKEVLVGKHLLWFDRPSPDSMSQHAALLSELAFIDASDKQEAKKAKGTIAALLAQREQYQRDFDAARQAAKGKMTAAKDAERKRVEALSLEMLREELALRGAFLDEAKRKELELGGPSLAHSASREELVEARLKAPAPKAETLKVTCVVEGADYNRGGADFDRLMEQFGGEKLTNFTVPYRRPEEWPLPDNGTIDCVFTREDFIKILQKKAELPTAPKKGGEFVKEFEHDYFEPVEVFQPKVDTEFIPTSSAHFTALFTLNGFLGKDRPSFLQNTMQIINSLPMHQRMPVIGACL
jgi:hypothetical protein